MGFISIMFLNFLVLIFVVATLLGIVLLLTAIIIFIVRKIKIKNNRKVSRASKVLFIVFLVLGILCLMPITLFFLKSYLHRFAKEQEYRNLKNPVLLEQVDGEDAIIYNNKKLVSSWNLYLEYEKIDSIEKEEMCNFIKTLTPKAYDDFNSSILYKIKNSTGYDIFLLNSTILVYEEDLANILNYYENSDDIKARVYNSGFGEYVDCEFDIKKLLKMRKYYDDENRKKEFKWLQYKSYDFFLQSTDDLYRNHIDIVEIENHLYLSSVWSGDTVIAYQLDLEDEEYIREQLAKVLKG